MTLTKAGIYFAVFLSLYTGVLQYSFIFLYILFALMFVDCRDKNVRSLLGIIFFFEFMLYEVNLLAYFITAYTFETGKIWGDIILDVLLTLNNVLLVFAIYYRAEITQSFNRFMGLAPIDYMPTRADVIQIYIARILALYCCIGTIYLLFIAYDYSGAAASGNADLTRQIKDQFNKVSYDYGEYLNYLGITKLLTLMIMTHKWTHKQMGESRPSARFGA